MKKIFWLVIVLFVSLAWADEVRFLTDPTLSPDGKTVAFCYEGDIWSVSADGGTAYRLTGMEGDESQPRFSPDGRWLAFTGRQDGNANVYVVAVAGGPVRQLTFHDGSDQVDSWSWDSKTVYFTSDRYNNFSAYKVALAGGTPVRLFDNYFNTPHNVVEVPGGRTVLFTDTWESYRFATRKHYKGPFNPDIKSYDFATGEYKELTTYEGKDMWPTVDRQGTIYFVSDEANGEYNLYTFRNGHKTDLTRFPSSVIRPQVSADGRKVVFEKDYALWIYDVAANRSAALAVNVYRNDTLSLAKDFKTGGHITAFNVSPDGKKLAFVSRGELFTADIGGKFVRRLDTLRRGRVMEVHWLGDNRTLVYNQTVDGWLNWFRISADGSTAEVQITSEAHNDRDLSLNPDRTQAVYFSGRNDVRLLDLATWESKTLLTDELWGFYNDTPRFSPDGRYIVYTAYRHFERDILIHDLESGKTINITNTGVTESSPFWSPDGKYLYFSSDRTTPSYPRGDTHPKIWRLPLEKFDAAFRSDEFDKLFKPEEKSPDKEEKKTDTAKTDKKEKKDKVVVLIDWKDMQDRWEQISPDFGSQDQPYVIQKGDTQTVLYLSDHVGGRNTLWKTVISPFEPRKTEQIEGVGGRGLGISAAGDKLYVLVRGDIHSLDLAKNKIRKIIIDVPFRRDLRDEFAQMFDEVWANVQENYYDGDFHGVNWTKVGQHYRSLVPFVQTREDLRTLINDMLGELNSSHMGFRSMGPEEKTFYTMKTLATGIVFENDQPYVVRRVIKDTPADLKGKDIRPGDRLVKMDGLALDPQHNRESYFLRPGDVSEISLTFARGAETVTVKIHPQSSRAFKSRLYDDWIAANQKRVDEASDKQYAYVCMKDMTQPSLEHFLIEMTSQWYRRQKALILDLRYNTGGNVHDGVLNFLSQRPYTQWKYRGGQMAPQPDFAPAAHPIILLVNEQSLSDAEMTAAGFKALKLGKIIGTGTYRWLIFTSGKSLVDGSYYRLPAWGCFTLEGQDIENHGVQPDIEIKTTFKDRLEGRDPQIDRAVEEIRRELGTK